MDVDETVDEFLAHFGKLGMKWGHRSGDHPGASSSTNRQAHGDAKEFARAKLFYGEGAGTRRKLIKAKVEANSKRNPTYKAAFDHHLSRQDLGKHANKAQSERRRKDIRKSTGKTARGLNRAINGPFGPTLAVVGLTAAAGIAQNPQAAKRKIQQGQHVATQLINRMMKKPMYYSPTKGFYHQ